MPSCEETIKLLIKMKKQPNLYHKKTYRLTASLRLMSSLDSILIDFLLSTHTVASRPSSTRGINSPPPPKSTSPDYLHNGILLTQYSPQFVPLRLVFSVRGSLALFFSRTMMWTFIHVHHSSPVHQNLLSTDLASTSSTITRHYALFVEAEHWQIVTIGIENVRSDCVHDHTSTIMYMINHKLVSSCFCWICMDSLKDDPVERSSSSRRISQNRQQELIKRGEGRKDRARNTSSTSR